jgi:rhodanese-related sulfurtransferase/DNA-binding transcriptional ArsR family regulator
MASETFTLDLFNQFARVGKALANGHRLRLIELLAQGPRSVDALARTSGLSVANTSQHLQLLRDCGLAIGRKVGQHVYYQLTDEEAIELLDVLRRLAAAHVNEASRIVRSELRQWDCLEAVSAPALLSRIQAGNVTVLDVRPPEEFAAGHVPGAVNIPYADLDQRMDSLSQRFEVVAYCRGPYCVLSFQATDLLRRRGFDAKRLEHGFPQWKRGGFPVEPVISARS